MKASSILRRVPLFLAAFLLVPGLALADNHEEKKEKKEMKEMAADMEMHGFHKDLMANFEDAEKKLVDLAEAMPADKLSWRPAEGVRSVSETLMHVARANYFFGSRFGGEMPENIADLEKITDKDEVMETLKASFAEAKKAMKSTADADLDEMHELPFGKFSSRSILMIMATHAHEHLGQTIAYARSNGVVPPWSQ